MQAQAPRKQEAREGPHDRDWAQEYEKAEAEVVKNELRDDAIKAAETLA